jgi:pyridoxal phosphate-dependent aminotransferase EpsN
MYFTHGEKDSISDRLFTQGVCLPSGSSLTHEEQQRVIDCIYQLLGG